MLCLEASTSARTMQGCASGGKFTAMLHYASGSPSTGLVPTIQALDAPSKLQ